MFSFSRRVRWRIRILVMTSLLRLWCLHSRRPSLAWYKVSSDWLIDWIILWCSLRHWNLDVSELAKIVFMFFYNPLVQSYRALSRKSKFCVAGRERKKLCPGTARSHLDFFPNFWSTYELVWAFVWKRKSFSAQQHHQEESQFSVIRLVFLIFPWSLVIEIDTVSKWDPVNSTTTKRYNGRKKLPVFVLNISKKIKIKIKVK